jgi:hypothetical protein
MEKLERIVKFTPAFDRRDPDPKKNYGIHGVTMRWVLKGEKGAVQFLVFTNWQLPHVTREQTEKMKTEKDVDLALRCFWQPMAADLGYHSKTPMYEGQKPMGAVDMKINPDESKEIADRFIRTETGTFTPCEYLDGAPCYYDGSGLQAETVLQMLIEKGGEAVWEYMESCYRQQFDEVEMTP